MRLLNTNLARSTIPTSTSTSRRTVASSRPVAEKRIVSPAISDIDRRLAISAILASFLQLRGVCAPKVAQAIQGTTAGRIPGLSSKPDETGFFQYTRPEGKSGGHGVGWSEIPQYQFKVPAGWAEIPVSIADLGGTEIDLRFSSKDQGELAVVVAPVLRFVDIGFNANIKIEDIGTPSKIIKGFGPELFGKPVEDEDVLSTEVTTYDGMTYYNWHVKPHYLVSATATRNRVFILSLAANARQWKKHSDDLFAIQKTFSVASA
ncbi:hypothetical protein CEUSTIGMA_g211.t1 [Chlamydomonas eustigma]|uniref:PsbP C-terminal domain-containing protein n=1 Tax=Chlamydomonas eustigma TaxID=1157962 RepID=A0A250WPI6_9CHLO|nr:hypothetical protein CEUSTIGMA_g211.t1 [Chlamydomonas eustigma]|eukprot:GAX72755.1 hypothetical protein CEUSTIGMA_g211.t1 [Chlamydomonas eustigma]